ncbi:MAG: tetratricopeptide repeat protein [Myxococcota bacterium]
MYAAARLRRALRGSIAALLLAAIPSPVSAQEPAAEGPPEEALEFFRSGREHYEAGRYNEARVDLEQALALDPESATLIFNLARIAELQGDLTAAIDYATRFRNMVVGNEEEVARAEATLRRLEGAREYLALRESAAPELEPLAPRVEVRERGVADGAFWAVLGTGGALLLAGAVTGGVAIRRQNEANDLFAASDDDRQRRADIRDSADQLALTADVFLIGGAAVATSALLLYLLRVRTYEQGAAQVDISPSSVGLRVGASF